MPELECPICRRLVRYTSLDEVPSRPFCSPQCQQIDLGRWLTEAYRISEEISEPERPADGERQGDRPA